MFRSLVAASPLQNAIVALCSLAKFGAKLLTARETAGLPQFRRRLRATFAGGCLRHAPALLAGISLVMILFVPAPVAAQEKSEEERFQAFAQMMANVKMVGSFTIVGQADPPKQDGAYVIKSVRKLPEGDYWVFDALVEHEGKKMPLEIPIEVKWSGDTPVITLENLTIPTLGTFSARIVLYRDAYAGMWVHGPVKGHMYGVIEKVAAEAPASEPKPEEKKP